MQQRDNSGMKTNSFVKNVASEIQVAIGSHNSTTGYFNQPGQRNQDGQFSSLNINDSQGTEIRPTSTEAKMKLLHSEYPNTDKKIVKINEQDTIINMQHPEIVLKSDHKASARNKFARKYPNNRKSSEEHFKNSVHTYFNETPVKSKTNTIDN